MQPMKQFAILYRSIKVIERVRTDMNLETILKSADPIQLFSDWYVEVQNSGQIKEPTAMTLATADSSGQPSARTVLLKEHSAQNGFIFYTNYHSHKGDDLDQNPKAALLFYWDPLFQQIRIQGQVKKISREKSEAYWNSRPFESQVAGWLSQQSRPVVGDLNSLYEDAKKEWTGKKIPCPQNWGGLALEPNVMEFWIGTRFRLHDSVRFSKVGQGWKSEILFP